MPKIDFNTALFVALGNKRKADFALHMVQQEIVNGNRAFTASAMLSVLEDCDDALAAVWREVRRTLHPAHPLDSQGFVPQPMFARTEKQPVYGMLFNDLIASHAQKRVREFLTKPEAVVPHQNVV